MYELRYTFKQSMVLPEKLQEKYMNAEYSTILFEQRHLIVKTVEGRTPFVVGSIYLKEIADEICKLLNEDVKKKGAEKKL